jgi:hypothetical protein
MGGTCHCDNKSEGMKRTFTITDCDSHVLQLSYQNRVPKNDPAYDDAEHEQDDFFLFVARLWNDEKWKAEVTKNWAA